MSCLGKKFSLGLVWKPGIPPGTRPFPWAGSPRGNRPRAKSSRHLEAHRKGISDPIHQFSTGQPSRPPEAGRRFPVARTRREEKLRLPPPPPSPPPLYHQAPPPLRVRAPPPLPSHRLLYLRRPSAARLPVGCNATTPSENSIYSSASSSSAGSTSYSSSAHVSPHPPS